MEKLLNWSIANSQGDKDAIARAGQPDPKLLAQLFGTGAPDDATLMKEAMTVVMDPNASLENKLTAMDNFEMLIENLDNANNIENLKLWEPLLKVLEFEEAELKSIALSIVGTAVQNNATSQSNFLQHENGLQRIIDLASNTEEDFEVRSKAFYALSNLLRNHEHMAQEFTQLDGLAIIPVVLNDKTVKTKLKMRAISLLTAYLSSVKVDERLALTLREDGVIAATIGCLQDEPSDVNTVDKVLAFLSQLISAKIEFTKEELSELGKGMKHIEPLKDMLNEEDYQTVRYVLE